MTIAAEDKRWDELKEFVKEQAKETRERMNRYESSPEQTDPEFHYWCGAELVATWVLQEIERLEKE